MTSTRAHRPPVTTSTDARRRRRLVIPGLAVALLGLASSTVVAASLATAAPAPTHPVVTQSVAHELAAATPAGRAKPTVVLVHGAWADASSWNGEAAYLRAAGYPVRAIANPVEDLTTDAQYVRTFVITNAATGDPDVKALVYVDAAAPATGETNGSLSGADSVLSTEPKSTLFTTLPEPGAPAGVSDLYLNEDVFVHAFGSDLPKARAEALWSSQRTASTAAFDTPSQTEAWATIPSWYFVSSGDRIITPTSELAMAKRAHSTVTLFHGGSHLTLISHPAAVTRTIAAAIASIR